ncbi:hypothetical protein [Mycolicibacterium sp. XJ1819]
MEVTRADQSRSTNMGKARYGESVPMGHAKAIVEAEGEESAAAADLADASGTAMTEAAGSASPKGHVSQGNRFSSRRHLVASMASVLLVGGLLVLNGWLGYEDYRERQAGQERERLVEAARQGALDLTTIGWEHAEADTERILATATGTFYDDFKERSQAFVDLVKKAKSSSKGTVAEAGLESESTDGADVLVAASVDTSNVGAEEQEARHWRMRISVTRVGEDIKISNVTFIP